MNISKIIIPGGAGLVGQNLIASLKIIGIKDIIVLDKHKKNLAILKKINPEIICEYADLSKPGEWKNYFDGADVVVMLQAQIGGNNNQEFIRNNIHSTINILDEVKNNPLINLIHISSSVVQSSATDFYTNTKKEQEKIVLNSGISSVILRPTLMFGWFDRKHLGWLSRFMQKMPIFPIPGNGKFMRQPLYCGDFCNIIVSCIINRMNGGIFNISGHEKIDYFDMICEIKRSTGAKALILKIPLKLFHFLLWFWSIFDKNPPFTTQQLQALTLSDEFEVIDWPKIFGVKSTPFAKAIHVTFNDPIYSKITLEF